MQKLSLNQSLQQRLSPQQIQFIKLLQIPTMELEQRIEEELEINPALEEGMEERQTEADEEFEDSYEDTESDLFNDGTDGFETVDISNYVDQDDYAGYKMYSDGWSSDDDRDTMPVAMGVTLSDLLMQQLGFLMLNEKDEAIGIQLIGSIESDGYIRRPLRSIANDLLFTQSIYTNEQEIEAILRRVHLFDPAGIGARDLRECLLLQLDRFDHQDPTVEASIRIVDDYFEEFSKKHYDKIQKRLGLCDEVLKNSIKMITRLNPKPGSMESGDNAAQFLLPDFLVFNNSGKIDVVLNSKNAPELKVSRSFSDMLDTYSKSDKNNKIIKETVQFVKQKLDAARWFIDAIKQRQQTLLKTMRAIVDYQFDFFLDGDESLLKPMILKDIATQIEMDISTVSRVANSKSVQTEFGIFPLKYFFSEGIATESGEDASSREVKNILKEMITAEAKKVPLSDDKLEKLLNLRGYNIARRTVAKYREQLNIPVARLRKQL